MHTATLNLIPFDPNAHRGSAMLGHDGNQYNLVAVSADGRLAVDMTGGGILDQYHTADMDTAEDTKYYGSIDSAGNWYILREITSTGSYRYTKGSADYADAWAARTTQTYTYFDLVF